jgi:3-phosphoshikimate 1-carboxyvinyltransferase
VISNFPANQDCLSTIEVLQKLGVDICFRKSNNKRFPGLLVTVHGKGLKNLKRPQSGRLFIAESGTTLRLVLGVLAGCNFRASIKVGRSLGRRPMLRVNLPLRLMGAKITSKVRMKGAKSEEYAPLTIQGGGLKSINYKMPVASAQVKSAVLLAGLCAKGKTAVIESVKTRDHTERMLKLFGAPVEIKKNSVSVEALDKLVSPGAITIPGDISSASFFIVAAAVFRNSSLIIKNVSLNPSRVGFLRVLKRMGGKIRIKKYNNKFSRFEPAGDIFVSTSRLSGVNISAKQVPSLIDELPILMVAASLAKGKSVFHGVGELRFKETDRIESMRSNLARMGVDIKVVPSKYGEDVIINAPSELYAAILRSFNDHRTAMSLIIAALAARDESILDDVSCIDKSFPDFLSTLKAILI